MSTTPGQLLYKDTREEIKKIFKLDVINKLKEYINTPDNIYLDPFNFKYDHNTRSLSYSGRTKDIDLTDGRTKDELKVKTEKKIKEILPKKALVNYELDKLLRDKIEMEAVKEKPDVDKSLEKIDQSVTVDNKEKEQFRRELNGYKKVLDTINKQLK